jgi:hypothetical protein
LAYFGKPKGILRNALDISQGFDSGEAIDIPDYTFTKSNIGRIQNRFQWSEDFAFLEWWYTAFEGSRIYLLKRNSTKVSIILWYSKTFELMIHLEDVGSLCWFRTILLRAGKRLRGVKESRELMPDGTPYIWSEGPMDLCQKNDKPLRTYNYLRRWPVAVKN